MSLGPLLQLVVLLAPLSLVAVGGVTSVLPEIHRQVVQEYAWLTDPEFAALFALVQPAPGPNVILLVSLIGWKVAGWPGAAVALFAICLPSSALAYALTRVWYSFRHAPWRGPVQAGLAPISIGLVLASGAVMASAANTTITAYAVTAATVVLVLRTELHPLVLLAAAAGLALAGWL